MARESTQFWNPYKVARNRVNSMIRSAKTKYYKSSLDDNFKKPKLLWKNLEYLDLHRTKGSAQDISPEFTADALNNEFLKVFSSAPATPSDLSQFNNLENPNVENIDPLTLSEISEKDIISFI